MQALVEHFYQGTETLGEFFAESDVKPLLNFQVCIKLLTFLLMSFDAEASKQKLWWTSEGFTN